MKITFVLPYAGLAGGVRVVAIYAQWLSEQGHQVNVISTSRRPIGLKRALRYLWADKKFIYGAQRQADSHLDGGTFDWRVVAHNGPVVDQDVPDADVVIATWWKTADWVNKLAPSKGKKIYFCQHYETHDYFPRDQVEASYFYPMLQICVSDWIRQQISSLTGRCDQEVVMNGVDTGQFQTPDRQKNQSARLGFVYSPLAWKGIDIIVDALAIAKRQHSDITALCFGAKPPVATMPLPDWIEFHENPGQTTLAEIYAQCDGWLFASRVEGFGLPILEAMACRTPVIATPAGAAPDLISKQNGFLLDSYSAEALAVKIDNLVTMDKQDWHSMSRHAFETAGGYDWSIAASGFEALLVNAVREQQ